MRSFQRLGAFCALAGFLFQSPNILAANDCRRAIGGYNAELQALGLTNSTPEVVLDKFRDAKAIASSGDIRGATRTLNEGLRHIDFSRLAPETTRAVETIYLSAPKTTAEKRSYKEILACLGKKPAFGHTLHALIGGSGAIGLVLASDLTADTEDVVLLGASAIAASGALWRSAKLPGLVRACLKGETPTTSAAAPSNPAPNPVQRIIGRAKIVASIGITVLPWAVLAFDKYTDAKQRSRIDNPSLFTEEYFEPATPVSREETPIDQIVW